MKESVVKISSAGGADKVKNQDTSSLLLIPDLSTPSSLSKNTSKKLNVEAPINAFSKEKVVNDNIKAYLFSNSNVVPLSSSESTELKENGSELHISPIISPIFPMDDLLVEVSDLKSDPLSSGLSVSMSSLTSSHSSRDYLKSDEEDGLVNHSPIFSSLKPLIESDSEKKIDSKILNNSSTNMEVSSPLVSSSDFQLTKDSNNLSSQPLESFKSSKSTSSKLSTLSKPFIPLLSTYSSNPSSGTSTLNPHSSSFTLNPTMVPLSLTTSNSLGTSHGVHYSTHTPSDVMYDSTYSSSFNGYRKSHMNAYNYKDETFSNQESYFKPNSYVAEDRFSNRHHFKSSERGRSGFLSVGCRETPYQTNLDTIVSTAEIGESDQDPQLNPSSDQGKSTLSPVVSTKSIQDRMSDTLYYLSNPSSYSQQFNLMTNMSLQVANIMVLGPTLNRKDRRKLWWRNKAILAEAVSEFVATRLGHHISLEMPTSDYLGNRIIHDDSTPVDLHISLPASAKSILETFSVHVSPPPLTGSSISLFLYQHIYQYAFATAAGDQRFLIDAMRAYLSRTGCVVTRLCDIGCCTSVSRLSKRPASLDSSVSFVSSTADTQSNHSESLKSECIEEVSISMCFKDSMLISSSECTCVHHVVSVADKKPSSSSHVPSSSHAPSNDDRENTQSEALTRYLNDTLTDSLTQSLFREQHFVYQTLRTLSPISNLNTLPYSIVSPILSEVAYSEIHQVFDSTDSNSHSGSHSGSSSGSTSSTSKSEVSKSFETSSILALRASVAAAAMDVGLWMILVQTAGTRIFSLQRLVVKICLLLRHLSFITSLITDIYNLPLDESTPTSSNPVGGNEKKDDTEKEALDRRLNDLHAANEASSLYSDLPFARSTFKEAEENGVGEGEGDDDVHDYYKSDKYDDESPYQGNYNLRLNRLLSRKELLTEAEALQRSLLLILAHHRQQLLKETEVEFLNNQISLQYRLYVQMYGTFTPLSLYVADHIASSLLYPVHHNNPINRFSLSPLAPVDEAALKNACEHDRQKNTKKFKLLHQNSESESKSDVDQALYTQECPLSSSPSSLVFSRFFSLPSINMLTILSHLVDSDPCEFSTNFSISAKLPCEDTINMSVNASIIASYTFKIFEKECEVIPHPPPVISKVKPPVVPIVAPSVVKSSVSDVISQDSDSKIVKPKDKEYITRHLFLPSSTSSSNIALFGNGRKLFRLPSEKPTKPRKHAPATSTTPASNSQTVEHNEVTLPESNQVTLVESSQVDKTTTEEKGDVQDSAVILKKLQSKSEVIVLTFQTRFVQYYHLMYALLATKSASSSDRYDRDHNQSQSSPSFIHPDDRDSVFIVSDFMNVHKLSDFKNTLFSRFPPLVTPISLDRNKGFLGPDYCMTYTHLLPTNPIVRRSNPRGVSHSSSQSTYAPSVGYMSQSHVTTSVYKADKYTPNNYQNSHYDTASKRGGPTFSTYSSTNHTTNHTNRPISGTGKYRGKYRNNNNNVAFDTYLPNNDPELSTYSVSTTHKFNKDVKPFHSKKWSNDRDYDRDENSPSYHDYKANSSYNPHYDTRSVYSSYSSSSAMGFNSDVRDSGRSTFHHNITDNLISNDLTEENRFKEQDNHDSHISGSNFDPSYFSSSYSHHPQHSFSGQSVRSSLSSAPHTHHPMARGSICYDPNMPSEVASGGIFPNGSKLDVICENSTFDSTVNDLINTINSNEIDHTRYFDNNTDLFDVKSSYNSSQGVNDASSYNYSKSSQSINPVNNQVNNQVSHPDMRSDALVPQFQLTNDYIDDHNTFHNSFLPTVTPNEFSIPSIPSESRREISNSISIFPPSSNRHTLGSSTSSQTPSMKNNDTNLYQSTNSLTGSVNLNKVANSHFDTPDLFEINTPFTSHSISVPSESISTNYIPNISITAPQPFDSNNCNNNNYDASNNNLNNITHQNNLNNTSKFDSYHLNPQTSKNNTGISNGLLTSRSLTIDGSDRPLPSPRSPTTPVSQSLTIDTLKPPMNQPVHHSFSFGADHLSSFRESSNYSNFSNSQSHSDPFSNMFSKKLSIDNNDISLNEKPDVLSNDLFNTNFLNATSSSMSFFSSIPSALDYNDNPSHPSFLPHINKSMNAVVEPKQYLSPPTVTHSLSHDLFDNPSISNSNSHSVSLSSNDLHSRLSFPPSEIPNTLQSNPIPSHPINPSISTSNSTSNYSYNPSHIFHPSFNSNSSSISQVPSFGSYLQSSFNPCPRPSLNQLHPSPNPSQSQFNLVQHFNNTDSTTSSIPPFPSSSLSVPSSVPSSVPATTSTLHDASTPRYQIPDYISEELNNPSLHFNHYAIPPSMYNTFNIPNSHTSFPGSMSGPMNGSFSGSISTGPSMSASHNFHSSSSGSVLGSIKSSSSSSDSNPSFFMNASSHSNLPQLGYNSNLSQPLGHFQSISHSNSNLDANNSTSSYSYHSSSPPPYDMNRHSVYHTNDNALAVDVDVVSNNKSNTKSNTKSKHTKSTHHVPHSKIPSSITKHTDKHIDKYTDKHFERYTDKHTDKPTFKDQGKMPYNNNNQQRVPPVSNTHSSNITTNHKKGKKLPPHTASTVVPTTHSNVVTSSLNSSVNSNVVNNPVDKATSTSNVDNVDHTKVSNNPIQKFPNTKTTHTTFDKTSATEKSQSHVDKVVNSKIAYNTKEKTAHACIDTHITKIDPSTTGTSVTKTHRPFDTEFKTSQKNTQGSIKNGNDGDSSSKDLKDKDNQVIKNKKNTTTTTTSTKIHKDVKNIPVSRDKIPFVSSNKPIKNKFSSSSPVSETLSVTESKHQSPIVTNNVKNTPNNVHNINNNSKTTPKTPVSSPVSTSTTSPTISLDFVSAKPFVPQKNLEQTISSKTHSTVVNNSSVTPSVPVTKNSSYKKDKKKLVTGISQNPVTNPDVPVVVPVLGKKKEKETFISKKKKLSEYPTKPSNHNPSIPDVTPSSKPLYSKPLNTVQITESSSSTVKHSSIKKPIKNQPNVKSEIDPIVSNISNETSVASKPVIKIGGKPINVKYAPKVDAPKIDSKTNKSSHTPNNDLFVKKTNIPSIKNHDGSVKNSKPYNNTHIKPRSNLKAGESSVTDIQLQPFKKKKKEN